MWDKEVGVRRNAVFLDTKRTWVIWNRKTLFCRLCYLCNNNLKAFYLEMEIFAKHWSCKITTGLKLVSVCWMQDWHVPNAIYLSLFTGKGSTARNIAWHLLSMICLSYVDSFNTFFHFKYLIVDPFKTIASINHVYRMINNKLYNQIWKEHRIIFNFDALWYCK